MSRPRLASVVRSHSFRAAAPANPAPGVRVDPTGLRVPRVAHPFVAFSYRLFRAGAVVKAAVACPGGFREVAP